MPASFKTCPPYPAGVVYSLLIGPKTVGLTAHTLSLAHAPNRETLPLNSLPFPPALLACEAVVSVSFKPSGVSARGHLAKRSKKVGFFCSFLPNASRAYPAWLEGNGNDCYTGYRAPRYFTLSTEFLHLISALLFISLFVSARSPRSSLYPYLSPFERERGLW